MGFKKTKTSKFHNIYQGKKSYSFLNKMNLLLE